MEKIYFLIWTEMDYHKYLLCLMFKKNRSKIPIGLKTLFNVYFIV